MSYTHTYAMLGVSQAAFDEIKAKLEEAGYSDQFIWDRHDENLIGIDMHGLALEVEGQS